MGELYEGVVFCSAERTARRAFASVRSGLSLRLVRLARGVFGIYRVAGRTDLFDVPAVREVAKQVATEVGQAVALFYDNRSCTYFGVLYCAGRRAREIGHGDSWWAPVGEDGKLVKDGVPVRGSELEPGVDYHCTKSVIDAALEAVTSRRTVTPKLLLQAFCYDKLAPLAESRKPDASAGWLRD
jgi:hypothetical protein